jgi:hypothetical protein
MLIREVTDVDNEKLIALGQYLIGRADDTGAKKAITIDAFVNMAQSMGLNLSKENIRDLAEKPPLNNVIVNITDDEVIFTGANSASADTMTVDQAEKTVEKMAKRAMD